MASDAGDGRPARRLLTFGRVEEVRIQVGYRARFEAPAYQQFLLDVPVPEDDGDADADLADLPRLLAALEPVLYVGSDAPQHYSLHHHRWHTSWGPSPDALEIGLLVTTGTRSAAGQAASRDSVARAFRDVLDVLGRPEPEPISRNAAIARARRSAVSAYHLDPATLSLSEEEHHRADRCWSVTLRTPDADEYDVLVGLVDGYAGSAWVRHVHRAEVLDSVGAE
jgi:hypothetical protein